MEIVVFGAGSLGSLLGGLLAREHVVTLVGRRAHVERIRKEGLQIDGEYELTTRPRARTDANGLTGDLALVTVKSYDTEQAARALAIGRYGAVASLQNGLGNESILVEHLSEATILAGTTTFGALLREPGIVECTGVGSVTLGLPAGGRSDTADRVAHAFRDAGIKCESVTDMPRRLWEKLSVNAGINPVTALLDVRNGALSDGPGYDVAIDAATETARVARAIGIDLSNERAVSSLRSVIDSTAENVSSMARDLRSGRRTEIDALNGAVVDRAPADVPVPVNRTLAALIGAAERR